MKSQVKAPRKKQRFTSGTGWSMLNRSGRFTEWIGKQSIQLEHFVCDKKRLPVFLSMAISAISRVEDNVNRLSNSEVTAYTKLLDSCWFKEYKVKSKKRAT